MSGRCYKRFEKIGRELAADQPGVALVPPVGIAPNNPGNPPKRELSDDWKPNLDEWRLRRDGLMAIAWRNGDWAIFRLRGRDKRRRRERLVEGEEKDLRPGQLAAEDALRDWLENDLVQVARLEEIGRELAGEEHPDVALVPRVGEGEEDEEELRKPDEQGLKTVECFFWYEKTMSGAEAERALFHLLGRHWKSCVGCRGATQLSVYPKTVVRECTRCGFLMEHSISALRAELDRLDPYDGDEEIT